MRKTLLSVLASAALIAALMASPAFGAKGPPTDGGETTLGNNLSVPAIFVPSTTGAPALRVDCGPLTTPQDPEGEQSTQFPGYWLQKTDATWSATCDTTDSATVTAQWGANLTDSPSLAAGKPIRIEVGLLDKTRTGWTGYKITNLTPELADRLATYGTDGTKFYSGVDGGADTRVWAPYTYLMIENLDTEVAMTVPMTAEINSTGAVVYGYNWGSQGRKNTPSAGNYRLTFFFQPPAGVASGITINDVVTGAVNSPTFTANSTSLTITLTPVNRGGGGRR